MLGKAALISLQRKELAEATAGYRRILDLEPDNFDAQFNLGNLLMMLGRADEAVAHYQAAVRLRPEVAQAHKQLGVIFAMRHDYVAAAQVFEKALAIDENMPGAHYNLAMVREQQGRDREAVLHYRRRLAMPRASLSAAMRLAWILATSPDEEVRMPAEAVELAEKCAQATDRQDPLVLDRLAAAYAAAGDFERAVNIAKDALQLASERQLKELSGQIESRLELYQQDREFRRPARPLSSSSRALRGEGSRAVVRIQGV